MAQLFELLDQLKLEEPNEEAENCSNTTLEENQENPTGEESKKSELKSD